MFVCKTLTSDFIDRISLVRASDSDIAVADALTVVAAIDPGKHHVKLDCNPLYWSFLDSVCDNIETGQLQMHPSVWVQMLSDEFTPMTKPEKAIAYRRHCDRLLAIAGVPKGGSYKDLVLKWSTNPTGISDMAGVIIAIHTVIHSEIQAYTDLIN